MIKVQKKAISILLSLVMMISLMPQVVFAASGDMEENPVSVVQEMMDSLPEMQDITEDNAEEVMELLDEIDAAKLSLTDEELMELDFSKYDAAAFVLSVPTGMIALAIVKDSPENNSPTPCFSFLDEDGTEAVMLRNANSSSACTSIEVEVNGDAEYIYIEPGTYTLLEEVEGEWNLSMSVNGKSVDGLTYTFEAGKTYSLAMTNTKNDCTGTHTYEYVSTDNHKIVTCSESNSGCFNKEEEHKFAKDDANNFLLYAQAETMGEDVEMKETTYLYTYCPDCMNLTKLDGNDYAGHIHSVLVMPQPAYTSVSANVSLDNIATVTYIDENISVTPKFRKLNTETSEYTEYTPTRGEEDTYTFEEDGDYRVYFAENAYIPFKISLTILPSTGGNNVSFYAKDKAGNYVSEKFTVKMEAEDDPNRSITFSGGFATFSVSKTTYTMVIDSVPDGYVVPDNYKSGASNPYQLVINDSVQIDKDNSIVDAYEYSELSHEWGVVIKLWAAKEVNGTTVVDKTGDGIYEDEVGNQYIPNNDGTWTIIPKEDSSDSSSATSGHTKKYNIIIDDTIKDIVKSDNRTAKRGKTITLTVKTGKADALRNLTVLDRDGDKVALTDNGDGTYSFTMPRSSVTVTADSASDNTTKSNGEIILTVGERLAWVFGTPVMNDVAPIIRNERTMLPIRFIVENLGGEVTWNDVAQKVTITKGDLTIEIFVGQDIAFVNGKTVTLDSPAFIENGRTYLPLRFVAENLDATVTWQKDTKQIYIVPEK